MRGHLTRRGAVGTGADLGRALGVRATVVSPAVLKPWRATASPSVP
jgi:hypothetical protein